MVEVTWFGHACVGLQHGRDRLVMDPFGPTIGLTPLATTADLVTVSHDNVKWHSNTAGVGGEPQVRLHGQQLAKAPVTALGMRLMAQVVGEDLDRGGEPNAMVRVTVDGLTFIHFGDLGHAIEAREDQFLAGADVWFALAGGKPTIPLDLLVEAWSRHQPRIMIPIHFRTPSMTNFGPVDDLLKLLPDSAVRRVGSSRAELAADALPDAPEVWVLDPLCDPRVAAAAG